MTAAGLPPLGRAIHREVSAAVAAATAQDPVALRDACGRLRALDETMVRDVLHTMTLGLIEKALPDGLDGDDLRALLDNIVRLAMVWFPALDPHAVVLVLTGALSVHEPDAPIADAEALASVHEPDAPIADAEALALACALVVSHLLHQLRIPLEPELTGAFDELRRAQTMELP